MHYEGSSRYTTGFGGFITIVYYVLCAVNAVNICTDFMNNENQTEISRTISENMSKLGEQSFVERNFTVAVYDFQAPEFGRYEFFAEITDQEKGTTSYVEKQFETSSCDFLHEFFDS